MSRFFRTFRRGLLACGLVAALGVVGCYLLPPGEGKRTSTRTLTRADYKLTPALARELGDFLKAHSVLELETEVTGDTLTVTTSRSVQRVIDGFVAILKSPPPPAPEAESATSSGR